MDFDIGTLIYILLTIVFIVIGSLGKKKKPVINAPGEESAGTESMDDPITENLKKLFGDFETSTGEEIPNLVAEEELPLDTIYDKLDSLESPLDKPIMEGGTGFYKIEDHIREIMESSPTEMRIQRTDQSSFVKDALKDFSPKKGILYAEIFRPKYF